MTTPLPENDPTREFETRDESTRDQSTRDQSTVLAEEPAAPGEVPPSPMVVAPDDQPRRPMRMRTVVLGLIMLVIAGCVLIAELTDVSIDPGAVILTLMIAAGVLLIAGARRS